MTLLSAIFLGLIEGITEFLPISSTAHLIISGEIINYLQIPYLNIYDPEALKSFLIIVQLGAILSVFVIYIKKIFQYPKIILKLLTAFIPTAVIGLLVYKLVKTLLMESLPLIASMLLLGGIALLILESYFNRQDQTQIKTKNLASISYQQAFLIGIFQVLAVIPGVSRSAATIMGGLSLGLNRKTIVEFSFLLALPTMTAATFLDLYKTPLNLSQNDLLIWSMGILISFLTAFFSIKFLLQFIKKNNFLPFAWYRIALGALILLIIIL